VLLGRCNPNSAVRQREFEMTEPTLFSIGEVAAILGMSPHTIRAWERRYQVLMPRRNAAQQRRYTASDVDQLLKVKQLVTRYGFSLKVAVETAQGELSISAMSAAADREPPDRGDSRRQPDRDERFWQSVFDLVPQAIVILNRTGRIREANATAAHLFAHPVQRLVGRRLTDFVAAPARKLVGDFLQGAFSQSRVFEAPLRSARDAPNCWFDCRPFMSDCELWLAVFASPVSPERRPKLSIRPLADARAGRPAVAGPGAQTGC
jgi:DNA-binding transcriptional MerR regulator